LQQRNVSLGDRLEEPVFLEEMLVLRMPDERQVRVENEREVTGHESGKWIGLSEGDVKIRRRSRKY
jgi:hypothetical protein